MRIRKQRVRARPKVHARRRRHLQVLAVGLAGAGGAWAVLGGMGAFAAGWLRSASLWRIQHIEIEGARPAIHNTLTGALPVHVGDSLWGFSRAALERRLQDRVPSLARVRVRRRWPARLVLRVHERTPVGWSRRGNARWAVDADGVLFPAEGPEQLVTLPEFVAANAAADRQRLTWFLAAWGRVNDPLQRRLVRCAMDSSEGISVWLDDGTRVLWGAFQENRMTEMRARLVQVLTDAQRRYPKLEYADLRYLEFGATGRAEGRIVIKPLLTGGGKEEQRGSS